MVSISEGDALAACGSFAFARAVVEDCPYSSRDSLIERAREIWWTEVSFFFHQQNIDRCFLQPGGLSEYYSTDHLPNKVICAGAYQGLAASVRGTSKDWRHEDFKDT